MSIESYWSLREVAMSGIHITQGMNSRGLVSELAFCGVGPVLCDCAVGRSRKSH